MTNQSCPETFRARSIAGTARRCGTAERSEPRVVQLNRGVEDAAGQPGPGLTIATSDVYDWMPGGFFVVHSAFGRAGEHVQTVLHARTDDGVTYTPSMRVKLVKVD